MTTTAIILNYNRPFNLKHIILPRLCRHPEISEVIISHGKKNTKFHYESQHCNVVNRIDTDNNKDYGLSLRFLAMLSARNDKILLLDDDLFVFQQTITKLVDAFNKDSAKIHGLFGRKIDENYNYIMHNAYGAQPIILTRCMVLHKKYADIFMQEQQLMQDILPKGVPLWNGEDIFVSLLAMRQNQRANLAYRLPYINLLYSELNGISTKYRNNNTLSHKDYRRLFAEVCIKRLELQGLI